MFHRLVKCQICDFKEDRHSPVLAKPCPKCGSRMTYEHHQDGDQPVTPDDKLDSPIWETNIATGKIMPGGVKIVPKFRTKRY